MKVGTSHGSRGVVATGHANATDAAVAVLRAGGNAVDAAACAALVLTVVAPYACTLGGDLFALVFEPGTGLAGGLNGTGRSPIGCDPAAFPGGPPRSGIHAATVPGLLRALGDLLDRYGTIELRHLIEPAIAFATDGFTVHPTLAAAASERSALLAEDRAAADLFLPGGAPLREGAHFVQPDLGRILRAVAERGVDDFYAGDLADRFVRAAHAAGGTFAREDFAQHASLWQAPLTAPFYGYDVWTTPPNSYGATALLQLLELEAGGIDTVDPSGAEFIARGFRARRDAYKLAARWIADPDVAEEPMRELLADAIASSGRFDDESTHVPPEARDRCTTNAIVIDGAGLAVSLVESISAPFGSGMVLPGTGIVLNNRMAGFSADPAHANAFGAGKRPANTLAPCMVTRDDRLVMSVGTPGTVGQTCTLAQVLARMVACGQAPEVAIAEPRWSVDFAGKLVVEEALDADTCAAVVAGHPDARRMPTGWISFGSIKCAIAADDGVRGFADFRRAATTAAV